MPVAPPLHRKCVDASSPLPPLAPFIGKAGFMDEGSHGRRMVCKELDVTSTTHELLTHTHPVCDRSSIAPTALGIWKSQAGDGLNCTIVEEDFEYGNPTGLAATPSFAMQHTTTAGSPSNTSHTSLEKQAVAKVLAPYCDTQYLHHTHLQCSRALPQNPSPPLGTHTCL